VDGFPGILSETTDIPGYSAFGDGKKGRTITLDSTKKKKKDEFHRGAKGGAKKTKKKPDRIPSARGNKSQGPKGDKMKEKTTVPTQRGGTRNLRAPNQGKGAGLGCKKTKKQNGDKKKSKKKHIIGPSRENGTPREKKKRK